MTAYVQRLSAFGLFLFCTCILFVSLFANNRMNTGQHTRLLTTRLYFSEEILPDNMLYLPLMARDRAKLVVSTEKHRMFLQLEFAENRYQSAQKLLENGQEALAVSTMTKSQKYLLQAVYQVRSQPSLYSPEEQEQARAALEHSIVRLEEFQGQLSSEAWALETLQAESKVVLEQTDLL